MSIVAFFVVKRVFTITEIVCEDQVYYSAEQILEAAGAKTGVGIFFVDEEQMRANALQELPLLMDLQIQKVWKILSQHKILCRLLQ